MKPGKYGVLLLAAVFGGLIVWVAGEARERTGKPVRASDNRAEKVEKDPDPGKKLGEIKLDDDLQARAGIRTGAPVAL